jgi:hypothetical protein
VICASRADPASSVYTLDVDDQELARLLAEAKSDRSERTESTSKTDKFG